MRTSWNLAMCFALMSCAHAAPTTTSAGSAPTSASSHRRGRSRGGPRAVALEAATVRAEQCLGHGQDGIGVEGSFDGATGRFSVERILGVATTDTEEHCVITAFEEARVDPFEGVAPEENCFVTTRGLSAEEREARYRVVHGHGSEEDHRGWIDRAAVSATLQQATPTIRRCYDDERARVPGLVGAIRVHVRIALNGRVDHAVSLGPPALGAVGDCVIARLRALEWPHPHRAAVTFLLPFTFRPES